MIKILNLSKEMVLKNIEELIEIDKIIETNERWNEQHFLKELKGKWDYSFIAILNEEIVGFIICSIKNTHTLHIHRLAVRKDQQKKGIGMKLINKIIDSVINNSNDVKDITLKIDENNKSVQKFYEKFYFRHICVEENNYIYRRIL